jgi:hypothetical protein
VPKALNEIITFQLGFVGALKLEGSKWENKTTPTYQGKVK